jgi:hypothetical protein
VQAVKAGKFEDRYENALVELLNQEAQARAGTNGRETARYRQRRQPDGCAGKSLSDVGKGGASQPAKGRKAKKAASGQRGTDGDFRQGRSQGQGRRRRQIDRNVAGFFTLQDLVDIICSAPEGDSGNQSAFCYVLTSSRPS